MTLRIWQLKVISDALALLVMTTTSAMTSNDGSQCDECLGCAAAGYRNRFLLAAAKEGHVLCVEALLKLGADVNCEYIKTPLINAAARGPKQTFAIYLFQEKMSFTNETSSIEKNAKYRGETKNIHFFSYNVYFAFQKIGNNQNILRKIYFHIKAIKARIVCLIFQ